MKTKTDYGWPERQKLIRNADFIVVIDDGLTAFAHFALGFVAGVTTLAVLL